MWLCVLFVLLLISIFAFYKVNQGDILSASFISSVSYTIAVFVALLCYHYWGVTYSYKLPLVIMTCIFSIFIGEKLCIYLIKKNNWRYLRSPVEENRVIKPDDRVLAVLFGLGVLTCVFQYFYTLHIAKMFGYKGTGYMMEVVRNAYLFHDVPKIYPLVVLCYFQTGVAYVCTLILVKNIINGQPNRHNIGQPIRSNFKYVSAVLPYFVLILLTSGRAGFMSYFCVTFFMIFVVLLNKNKNGKEVIFKFIKYGFLFAFAFIAIFWLAGYLTGKSQNYGFFDTLTKYVGSSIAGLNDHIVNREPQTDFQTFYGVKTFLNRFGFNIPIPDSMYRDGITFPNNSGTNLYTAIWIYYNDFGWGGVIFLNIIFGFVVTLFENFAKRSGNDIWKIIYGYYGYFLIRQIFAEDFFSYILTTTRILDLFSIVCCFYLLYKPFWKVSTKKPFTNETDKMKILFLPEYDYWDAVRSKLEKTDGVLVAETFSKNKLWYYHNSIRLNSYVPLPFKRIWYSQYFQVNKPENVKLILFFEYIAPAYDKRYLSYLRKKYPNAVLAFFIVNPINHENKRYLEKILPLYDKVITFDENEAEKNGFLYFNGLYERDDTIRESAAKSDVFFVGRGKDRLNMIHEIYQYLTTRGFKCDFYVNNVEKEKQLQGTDIHYNCWLNYKQVLQHVVDTKCVLEILQGEQHGFTMRTCEAITYKRRLITNNQSLKDQPFYDPRFMCIIEKASDIPDDFINDAREVEVSGADFSVERFINFLETI